MLPSVDREFLKTYTAMGSALTRDPDLKSEVQATILGALREIDRRVNYAPWG